MSLAELLPLVQELPRAEKQTPYRHIAQQLANGQEEPPADANDYTTRQFRENNEAAQILMGYLYQEK